MTSHTDRFVSRRAALAGLGVGGLSVVLAVRPHILAIAQDATPVAEVPRTEHLLNGPWEWSWSIDELPEPNYGIFHPGGLYLEFDATRGVGIGYWRATSERMADLVVQYQNLSGRWQKLTGPEEMHEPDFLATTTTFAGDIIVLRTVIQLSEASDAITQTGEVTAQRNSVVVYVGPFTRNAKRIGMCE